MIEDDAEADAPGRAPEPTSVATGQMMVQKWSRMYTQYPMIVATAVPLTV
jgi:hypothetical protein